MSTSNLKISIAALSLCVSAVAIYIHLPYVIAAVSGSGAIEALPLAIFTISAIVALVSAIYLIRLAVSRAGDEKKIDLIKQDRGSQTEVNSGTSLQDKSSVPTSPSRSTQTCDTAASQVPQEKPVKHDRGSQTEVDMCKNCTNPGDNPVKHDRESQTEVDSDTSLRDKSSVPTPTPPPVTFGTQPNPSVSVPPPPPLPTPEQLNQAGGTARENSANTTDEKPPVGTTQKNASHAKFTPPKGQVAVSLDDITNTRAKLKKVHTTTQGQKQDGGDSNSKNIALITLASEPDMRSSDSESNLSDHENDWDAD
ncbi:hypothetical protein [Wolbachia endosymbiont (group A) of Pogonocherus hispidulus]|uniref:hypothetical protein n=1 Tax=Wolbachia endosymbiont (group A) of Pogonocherus hispidulus TaxID=3066136 RepID=UPI003340C2B6